MFRKTKQVRSLAALTGRSSACVPAMTGTPFFMFK